MLILAVFLLLLAVAGYYRYRDFFAPAVLSPVSWGGVLLFYALLDHGMDEVSWKGISVITLWNISILIGTYFFSEINLVNRGKSYKLTFNPWVRKLYFWISVFGMIPLCFIAYKQGTTMDGSFWFNLRMANTGLVETEYKYGIFEYVLPFVFVAYLVELLLLRKGDSRVRFTVLLILNILLMVISMAKSTIFFTVLASFIVIGFRQRISLKRILIVGLVLFAGMASFQLLRAAEKDSGKMISDMFYVYVFGGIPALDQVVNSEMVSERPGQNIFAIYYNMQAKFAGDERPKKENLNDITDDGYLYVPLPTNVYTVIGPFWLDYGWGGIIFFGFIVGSMAGVFYRLARKGALWAIILYAYMGCVLLLQFFGEYIFTNLSYLLQLIILSVIAYKFNYILKWRKSISYLPLTTAKPI